MYELTSPVFDLKARNASHVIDVRGHECGVECECMGGDGGIDILD